MRDDFSGGPVRRRWRLVGSRDAWRPVRRRRRAGSRDVWRLTRYAAAALAVTVAVAAGLSGCASAIGETAHSSSISSPASHKPAAASDSGCVTALDAVSTYGPTALRNAARVSEFVDKVEIDLMVAALDAAASLAHDPQVKQSIRTLADAYLAFKAAWTGAAVPPLSAVLSATKHLETLCGH